jgi:hypothetical protein
VCVVLWGWGSNPSPYTRSSPEPIPSRWSVQYTGHRERGSERWTAAQPRGLWSPTARIKPALTRSPGKGCKGAPRQPHFTAEKTGFRVARALLYAAQLGHGEPARPGADHCTQCHLGETQALETLQTLTMRPRSCVPAPQLPGRHQQMAADALRWRGRAPALSHPPAARPGSPARRTDLRAPRAQRHAVPARAR